MPSYIFDSSGIPPPLAVRARPPSHVPIRTALGTPPPRAVTLPPLVLPRRDANFSAVLSACRGTFGVSARRNLLPGSSTGVPTAELSTASIAGVLCTDEFVPTVSPLVTESQ
jgi:hypothetical protein